MLWPEGLEPDLERLLVPLKRSNRIALIFVAVGNIVVGMGDVRVLRPKRREPPDLTEGEVLLVG